MPQKELITMTKKESERLNIINSLINGIIDGTGASKQMGVSTRQVRRLKQRVIKLGPRGIIHQSRGGKGNRSYSKEFLDKIKSILKTEYYYFTPTMAQEHLLTEHGMKLSIEKVRQLMIKEELWEPKKRRKKLQQLLAKQKLLQRQPKRQKLKKQQLPKRQRPKNKIILLIFIQICNSMLYFCNFATL